MTEQQVDLDMLRQALERDEREFGKSWSRDVVRDLLSERDSLAAELRQERERNAILTGPDSDERDALITDPLVRRIQEERERADEARAKEREAWRVANVRLDACRDATHALSRAEETIEKVRNLPRHELNALVTAVDAHDIDTILNEYGKQKEGDRG